MVEQVLVVHDDPAFLQEITAALCAAGFRPVAKRSPIQALDWLDSGRPGAIVTRANFGPGVVNGATLVRMANLQRTTRVQAVFVDEDCCRTETAGLGRLLTPPVTAAQIVESVRQSASLT